MENSKSEKTKKNTSSTSLTSSSNVKYTPNINFAHFPPFPTEGILGMYPIATACKRQVALHMVRFQRRLQEVYLNSPRVVTAIRDYKNLDPLDESYENIFSKIRELESDVVELRHKFAVERIKKKYGKHQDFCPCYDSD